METPDSTRGARGVRGGLRRAALALAAAAGALVLTSATATSPAAAEPGNEQKIAELTQQIKNLEKEYGGNLEQLRDTRLQAKKALLKVKLLRRDLETARDVVAQLAASRYMSNGLDPTVQVLASDDPNRVLSNASLAHHLSVTQAAKVTEINTLLAQQERARRDAEKKIKILEKEIADIAKERERVRQLLRRYKPESPMVGTGGMTPRMIKVRDEIEEKFGPFPVIGCTRPGDPLDHGSGRACDFMESTAGQMPSPSRLAHGDAVAAYAIRNATRLGIKYIIWKQRIWDVRSSGGWKMMSDRGSITQNHYDHVHISVF
ncbi:MULTISPECIES: coiled-coil domain-containing protein [Thermomonospora]|uniref:ARB-07466-like C-terminal domain-containing protein n=1 Tax=Thermomonospora curvata (strain ATCC 19995 / DSM 43183 / JCM 3096 / KCTC 9072 / NBRC 15933 / NCIMB 10081 / Henssen B9) TaxID=471852 RepID=D1A1I7_THECD|nr:MULTISPECIES: hypothetical protein [Thermomonospora]ACY95909.1 hypothetical protein Tcur_0305 [Thermomonospora curvata DSM 43183]PKK16153.1 MAG: hypothetical protein BUE48_001515 [Thermomonospora sp. CIF 1]